MPRPPHPHALQSRPRRHLPRQLAAPRGPGEQCRSPPLGLPALRLLCGGQGSAGWGEGHRRCGARSNLSRTLPPPPSAAGLQPPPPSEGRRPSSGKETSYIKAAGPLPSGDALCRAHLTGPAPRPPAPGTRDDPAAAARWAQGPSRPPATRPRAAPQCRPRSPAPPCAARLALAPNPELT